MITSYPITKNQPSLNELTNITIFEREIKNCAKSQNFLSNCIKRDNFVAKETCILCSQKAFIHEAFKLITKKTKETGYTGETFT